MAYRLGNRILKIDNKLFYASGVPPVNPVWSGLTSYWRLDETSGTIAYDSKGSVNGIKSNYTGGTAGINNYSTFLPISGRIDIGRNYTFERSDSFSFACWLKRVALNPAETIFISNLNTNPYNGYELIFPDGYLEMRLINHWTNNNKIQIKYETQLYDNNWHNVVFTYNGTSKASGCTIYYNANPVNFTILFDSLSGSIVSPQNTWIGQRSGGNNNIRGLNGYLDEVGMWNRVLTPAEVTSLYNAGNGLFY